MKSITISRLLFGALLGTLSLGLLGHSYAQTIVGIGNAPSSPSVLVAPSSSSTTTTTTTVTTTTLAPINNNNLIDLPLTPVTTHVRNQVSSSQVPVFTPPNNTSNAAANLRNPHSNSTAHFANEAMTPFSSFAEAVQGQPLSPVTIQSTAYPANPLETITTATLPPNIALLLQQGKSKAQEALRSYHQQHIGQPLWREAVQLGLQAADSAPNSPEPVYFLAQVYSLTNYWALAWESWLHYFSLGGVTTAEVQRQLANVGIEYGYLYYNEGRIGKALEIFRQVSDYAPTSPQGFIWTARVLYEQGDYVGALPYWQKAYNLAPNDEGIKFYLQESQARATPHYNPLQLFAQGVSSYEQANYPAAERFFRDALQGDNSNASAWAYLARAALAQHNLVLAKQAIGRATLIAPDNNEYRDLSAHINNFMNNN